MIDFGVSRELLLRLGAGCVVAMVALLACGAMRGVVRRSASCPIHPISALLIAASLIGAFIAGGTKPDGNRGIMQLWNQPSTNAESHPPPIDNYIIQQSTISPEDYEAGFVLAQTRTGEAHDFSMPTNAVPCSDWLAFGAADDWFRTPPGEFTFPLGTNAVGALTICSVGEARVMPRDLARRVSPLRARLDVAPAGNWRLMSRSPSQFWRLHTPSNSLVMTWQNLALWQDPSRPVSFQAEIFEDGGAAFRYDLSRAGCEVVTNVSVAFLNGGLGFETNALPTNVTTLCFQRLDKSTASNPDPDGDGLSTDAEVFVHHTNPYARDTDYDGLTDYEELFVYHTDPLDPCSVGAPYSDGLAARLGGLDPFSCPAGSTNTVLEHVFYSGSTNGVVSCPVSTDEIGVLKIMVSGSGAGRLIVGDDVVPLVGFQTGLTRLTGLRGGTNPDSPVNPVTNTLLLAVGKGVRKEVWFDKPDGLDVALDSDDFFIGEMPSPLRWKGWIAFPHTEATVPCIHDFNGNGKYMTLVHGEEFPGMTAEWSGGGAGVTIVNEQRICSYVYGTFPRSQTRSISYTVDHPDRLNPAPLTFQQTLRFCPQLTDAAEPGLGEGVTSGHEGDWPCHRGCSCSPDVLCDCCSGEECNCPAWNCPCADNIPSSLGDAAEEEGTAEAFTNIVNGAQTELPDVLYLYRANARFEFLEVPGGEPRHCCPCPEHRQTNYVARAYKSSRVAVERQGGGDFMIGYEPCTVAISGVSPSLRFRDAPVLFVTNGAAYKRIDSTVLGVKFELGDSRPPLSRYNRLSPRFGYPFVVCTNLSNAVSLRLKTDVIPTNGLVRISMSDVSGDVALWLPEWSDGQTVHPAEPLLEAGVKEERFIPIRRWRRILRRHSDETTSLAARLLASTPGGCTLRLEYVASDGAQYVHDFAEQRVTAVKPPLLVDYNRDGRIDMLDVAAWLGGRIAYFWVNDDRWKYDDAFDSSWFNGVNSANSVIDGRNDLVNFLPVAVDVAAFATNWSQNMVYYVIESDRFAESKVSFADMSWSQVGSAPFGDDFDLDGNPVRQAPVAELRSVAGLPQSLVGLSPSGSSTMLAEFPEEAGGDGFMWLKVCSRADDGVLFSAQIPIHVGDVANMIGWLNIRNAADGSGGIPTRLATDDWPDSEHEPGNVVFVHGYNMHEDEETKLWAQNVFKKLWWAGLDRGFIAVQWRGNEGQFYLPSEGWVTPNYYGNVQNAFTSASALKVAMDGIPGPKWFLAHSLGNMLVSAAIQDHRMPHEKYFMLNAAVAMEAFDPTNGITQASHDNMTPEAWTNYTDRVRATHWHELFPEGDGRRLLTWKGRFCNVTNIVNFYSTQEEVVCNGDGSLKDLGREYSWYNQECRKGNWTLMLHDNEGGWAFNRFYDTMTHPDPGNHALEFVEHLSPAAADGLSDDVLRLRPFFLDFANPGMYTSPNGEIVASNYLYRAEILAYAIPAESYAVGANPLPGLNAYTNQVTNEKVPSRNYNMALYMVGQEDLPENGTKAKDKYKDWQHSTFVQRSYKRTHQLFKRIMQAMKGEVD